MKIDGVICVNVLCERPIREGERERGGKKVDGNTHSYSLSQKSYHERTHFFFSASSHLSMVATIGRVRTKILFITCQSCQFFGYCDDIFGRIFLITNSTTFSVNIVWNLPCTYSSRFSNRLWLDLIIVFIQSVIDFNKLFFHALSPY